MKNGIYKEKFEIYDDCNVHYKDGKIVLVHIPDGPFRIGFDTYIHYKDGLVHREDGPAIEYSDGPKHWYLNDTRIKVGSQKEFERYLIRETFK